MSNFEHGAVVAELNAGIDAACNALQAATAAGDRAAVAAASADISRLVNDLQVAEEMDAACRADDAARAKDDLQGAIEATLGPSIDALNRALLGVGIPFLVGPEEDLVSAAREAAVARQQYEKAERAVVETAAALAHLDGVIIETEARRSAAVQAFVDGDRSDAARQKMITLADCLTELRAARADARELADGVESGEALRKLCYATALLERRQAQLLARVARNHIAHAESETAVAYSAAERLGRVTDKHLGAGTWARLMAG